VPAPLRTFGAVHGVVRQSGAAGALLGLQAVAGQIVRGRGCIFYARDLREVVFLLEVAVVGVQFYLVFYDIAEDLGRVILYLQPFFGIYFVQIDYV
jgi:hypothetical protein